MNSTFDWASVIFAAVIAAYIFAGVFIGRWMDEKFFDPCRVKKDANWRDVLRVLLWILYWPVVALLVRKGIKYRFAPKSEYEPPKSEPHTSHKAPPDMPYMNISEGFPEGITEIVPYSFAGREDLPEDLVIPGTVTRIGDNAFECSNLVRVVVSEGVVEIGEGVFNECKGLCEIHLPSTLKKLGDAFWENHYDGMDIYCHMPEPIPYALESEEGFPPNIYDVLYVPKGSKEKYEAVEPWNYYETIKEMK